MKANAGVDDAAPTASDVPPVDADATGGAVVVVVVEHKAVVVVDAGSVVLVVVLVVVVVESTVARTALSWDSSVVEVVDVDVVVEVLVLVEVLVDVLVVVDGDGHGVVVEVLVVVADAGSVVVVVVVVVTASLGIDRTAGVTFADRCSLCDHRSILGGGTGCALHGGESRDKTQRGRAHAQCDHQYPCRPALHPIVLSPVSA